MGAQAQRSPLTRLFGGSFQCQDQSPQVIPTCGCEPAAQGDESDTVTGLAVEGVWGQLGLRPETPQDPGLLPDAPCLQGVHSGLRKAHTPKKAFCLKDFETCLQVTVKDDTFAHAGFGGHAHVTEHAVTTTPASTGCSPGPA